MTLALKLAHLEELYLSTTLLTQLLVGSRSTPFQALRSLGLTLRLETSHGKLL
jgi:hypothetical protein